MENFEQDRSSHDCYSTIEISIGLQVAIVFISQWEIISQWNFPCPYSIFGISFRMRLAKKTFFFTVEISIKIIFSIVSLPPRKFPSEWKFPLTFFYIGNSWEWQFPLSFPQWKFTKTWSKLFILNQGLMIFCKVHCDLMLLFPLSNSINVSVVNIYCQINSAILPPRVQFCRNQLDEWQM